MTCGLISAYAASVARVASWVIVFGVVFRLSGPAGDVNLAVLALARGTVGLLSYASLGLTPVLVRLLTRDAADRDAARRIYSTAGVLVAVAAAIGATVLIAYVRSLDRFHTLTLPRAEDEMLVFLAVGIGTLLRTASDLPAAPLLAAGRIVTDSTCQWVAEVLFVGMAVISRTANPAINAACAYAISGSVLGAVRIVASSAVLTPRWASIDRTLLLPIGLLGGGVVIGQLADWLYAPMNQILIHHFLDPALVAPYAVAIQIDGGLLLLVGGLSSVLLPAVAVAHHEGRLDEIRRRYVRSMLAGLMVLAGGAILICSASRPLFEMWFGNPMPTARAILPWVLMHTVIGGTAVIGRSVLLGMGQVKAYTISALAGGVANVLLATLLLTQTSLGLHGVVLATVLTVVIRCGVWMPWYTLRCLRRPWPSPI